MYRNIMFSCCLELEDAEGARREREEVAQLVGRVKPKEQVLVRRQLAIMDAALALEEGEKQGLLARPEGVMESFIEELYDLLPRTELTAAKAKELPVVYSGLYGSGAIPVSTMLKKQGFEQLTCIQMNPDSNFGGLYMPNPEDPRVYAVALEEAEKIGAKMLMATDPDCDRVGVQVWHDGKFVALNGNQIGAMLIDYLYMTKELADKVVAYGQWDDVHEGIYLSDHTPIWADVEMGE